MTKKLAETVSKNNLIDLSELEQYVGSTAGDYSVDDFTVPYLIILQDKAKRVMEGGPQYVEGARPGMLYNSADNCVYDRKTGVRVIPCAYKSLYMEWISREAGGGIAGSYSLDEGTRLYRYADVNDKGKRILENGNEIALNHQHFVLVLVNDAPPFPAIIPMAGSQLKYSKRWNYQIHRFMSLDHLNPDPCWMRSWHVTTKVDMAKGHNFYSWDITQPEIIKDRRLLDEARSFREACLAGDVAQDSSKLSES